jgi:hypothetical protein
MLSRMSWWRPLLREPLLHFGVLGAALFVLYAFVGATDPGSRRIVVERGTLENLAASFARTCSARRRARS